ncbi:uncharacterized protein BXZ73DRAFT_47564 [Epithele typhae]|uniref:uncharacterized protein n=1 Tax=Epithele typhae TaxID=378194 RepID=UPI002007C71A|nr:uncharacterized protein BXZ73DRAFT_47564 [Epithele typhae]KAH9930489.1 hypothetical protein BXZ73DRAFT_47564 [Epithele typhae]
MGHVKNFAPGKAPKKLLDPPPESFARSPPLGPSYGPFPLLLLVGKGTTLDRGFNYAPPELPGLGTVGAVPVPHPFVDHDVNEQDWRRFVHDVRLAGSLSPMNRVVAGLAPLALPGVGIIFGFFIVKGIDSVVKRNKKGPVSQLIDHWNHFFFHPRCIHVSISQGPPKDRNGNRDPAMGKDSKWRLVVTYRAYVPE